MKKLLNIHEASEFLGCQPIFLRRRTSESWKGVRIPFYRIASRLMFDEEDLQNYAAFCKNSPHFNSKRKTVSVGDGGE